MNTIILEGPDGAGKSTLAEAFRACGYVINPFGVPPKAAQKSEESLFHFFFDPLFACSQPSSSPVVFDRLHLSDRVYAPLMRGGTPMTERAEALIERYVEAIDGQIIICLPPRRVAFANWAARPGREYVKDARIFHAVYDAYAKLLFNEKRNRNFLWYDYTRRRIGSFVNTIKDWRGFPLPTGVVGSQSPKFLFVGERPGPGDGPNLAFMTTRNCSGWLFDVIRDAGFEENEVAFVNAIGKDGKPFDLEMLLMYLWPRKLKVVIALGLEAEHHVAATSWGKNYQLAHPQYAKRFKAKERAAYVAQLKKIRREAK